MRLGATNSGHGLTTVYLELNYHCNFRCHYCYVGQKKTSHRAARIDIKALESALAATRQNGARELVFLGGEPTLSNSLIAAIRLGQQIGFESIGLVSNGTKIDRDLLATLSANNGWINLSMRGGSPRTFNINAGRHNAWDI